MPAAVRPTEPPAPSHALFRDGLHTAALSWFGRHGRPLNFRRTRDPYAVLVSEVIAQQTQIARVEAAWEPFLARFPTVAALAEAPVADVLRQWQGLGYNRRALHLQRAARAVVERHGGVFPADVNLLMQLPGVGPYTARAVAAIAFGIRAGAVDTNVRRVLGRVVLAESEAVAGPALQALADDLVPEGRAGEWTHALMDIGAGFCRPRTPRCDSCPLAPLCRFRAAVVGATAVGGPASSTRSRGRTARSPFRSTNRWLRGRLLDSARGLREGEWLGLKEAVGDHGPDAVAAAASAMVAEGLLEFHPTQPALARLPR